MFELEETEAFALWKSSLRDKTTRNRVLSRLDRAQTGNFGDCEPVGGGVSEMRLHFGPGYRIYFRIKGTAVIFLLYGGDKSTQSKDIEMAKRLAKEL